MTSVHSLTRVGSGRGAAGHEQIARVLGTEILNGVYPPGANIPTEAELLARFGISRTLLREVIKTLSAKGLVAAKTRVGTRVRDPVNWNLFDSELLSWRVSLGIDSSFRQSMAEIRRAVESRAAALAAVRRTAADIAELRRTVEEMDATITRAPALPARTFRSTWRSARLPAIR